MGPDNAVEMVAELPPPMGFPAQSPRACQMRLQRIVHELERCRNALQDWRLDRERGAMAHRLLAQLAQSIDALGAKVASYHSDAASPRFETLGIDRELDEVSLLSDKLQALVFGARPTGAWRQ